MLMAPSSVASRLHPPTHRSGNERSAKAFHKSHETYRKWDRPCHKSGPGGCRSELPGRKRWIWINVEMTSHLCRSIVVLVADTRNETLHVELKRKYNLCILIILSAGCCLIPLSITTFLKKADKTMIDELITYVVTSKSPAYGRHRISQPMRKVAPILFSRWRR